MKMAQANPTDLSDEDPTKMCDPCLYRGVNTLAGTKCTVCLEYLCDTCEAVHRSSKALRDHELRPLKESHRFLLKQNALISSIMVCDVHHTETLTHICVNHNYPICSACTSMKHSKCNTKTLKQVTKEAEVRKDVSLYIDKSKALLSEAESIKKIREKEKCLIQDCSSKCLQEVQKIKLQIIAWAEKLTKDMKDNVESTETKLLAEKEGDIKAAVEISKQMQGIVKSFEILGQDIEDATFVLMMKEKGNIEDGIAIKDEILKQVKPVKLEFQLSERLVTLMSDLTSMGELHSSEKQISQSCTLNIQEKRLSFQEIFSTTFKKFIIKASGSVTGLTFMPDGELVICNSKSVKVFTNDFKLKNELEIGSSVWGVAVVSNTEIIVTQPNSESLQILSVSKNIEKGRRIPVGRLTCYGIECKNDKLYVICQEINRNKGINSHKGDTSNGMLKVLKMDGVILKTFHISQENPEYLAVNSSGDKILVSTHQGVVCIDNNGKTLFTYSARQGNESRGLLFDSYDNFMVCDKRNSFIDVVKCDGTLHRILSTRDDDLSSPNCLAYKPSDNTLVVSNTPYALDSLLAFTLK